MAESGTGDAGNAKARTGFAPVVLLGLASAGLCAVASAKPWYAAAVDYKLGPGVRTPDTEADMPLALALSLVVLAAWGVVLVSRTRGRRIALALGWLAAAGVNACVWAAPSSLPDQVREQLGDDNLSVGITGWYGAAAGAAVVAIVVISIGLRAAPRWPSMGAKYDAPTGAPTGGTANGAAGVPAAETDLWKAFDAGQDPTAAEKPESP